MTPFSPRSPACGWLCACLLAGWLGFIGRDFFAGGPKPIVEQEIQRTSRRAVAATDFKNTTARPENSEYGCEQLIAQAPTLARNTELIAAIEKLAEQNPLRAIAYARGQTNRLLQAQLLGAALQGWGKTDGIAAMEWILSQPAEELDCGPAVASVLKGAVQNPDEAKNLTLWLNRQLPDQARECGDALIDAFAQNGDFAHAAEFARSGDGRHRTEWLAAAYSSWGNYQPQHAAANALALADADARTEALNAVIASWGQTDPKSLADFAVNNLPEGDQRTHALSHALVLWAAENPTAAATWINRFAPAAESDPGRAAVATQPNVIREPSVAIQWAQSIADPNFRSRTIAAVVETWSLSNPAAALGFVKASVDITSEDRSELLEKLAN